MAPAASKTWWTAAAIITVLFAAAYYWLLIDNRMPPGRFDLDIAVVRNAASENRGAAPAAIEVETVSHTMVPHIAMVAGTD